MTTETDGEMSTGGGREMTHYGCSALKGERLRCSGCGWSTRLGELALTGTKRPLALATEDPDVGQLIVDSGRPPIHDRRDGPVTASTAAVVPIPTLIGNRSSSSGSHRAFIQ